MDENDAKQRQDLPWQAQPLVDGSLKVAGIHLGHSTLQQARAQFKTWPEFAVFEEKDGTKSLEVFFGKVNFGPLQARIVVSLEAADTELTQLANEAKERKPTPSGAWKYLLTTEAVESLNDHIVHSLTYSPAFKSLEASFLQERFGEPAQKKPLEEGRQIWFYPQLGLRLWFDPKGGELMEFVPPRDFDQTTRSTARRAKSPEPPSTPD